METKFQTICEDGSTDELADIFLTMWRETGVGNFALVTNALAREFQRHEIVTASVGLEGGDAIDSDGEDEAEGDAMMMEEEAPTLVPVAPVVDEEGFETVVRGKKGKGGKR